MINPRLTDRQGRLFQTEVNWEQLPAEVRRQVIAMLTTLCIELVDETPLSISKEERHGPIED